ncbi:ABC transporter permease [Amycolatopsis cihanbeyliensis]|uniref:Nickel transport system permease protein n=1 Tax=Amycolatopsis cihanbeyliensis TaxID=1128664 RepID=A0A542DRI2_AMYCI|nr:ABC transporter permease [Amycolatopsis cihanbeyliensis]TQJ05595.1 nickel transport system permease protein [Amycolatopsis cihanbeyliensis]
MSVPGTIARIAGLGPAPRPVGVPQGLGRRLLAHRAFQVGLGCLAAVVLLAAAGPLLARDPAATDYANQLAAPSWEHWLGTDHAGRDSFARTVAGAYNSLGAALLVFTISTLVGLLLGAAAGLLGGVFDLVLNRFVDILLGLPSLVLSLAVIGALGPGFGTLILAMCLTEWARLAKLARAHTLGSAQRPEVIAARMAGAGPLRAAVGHVLPGTVVQVLIAATLNLGEIVLFLASLSFLGLGAQPPAAEWGNMIAESRASYAVAPWLLIGPGLGIVLCIAGATLISDALRDCTDPAGRL